MSPKKRSPAAPLRTRKPAKKSPPRRTARATATARARSVRPAAAPSPDCSAELMLPPAPSCAAPAAPPNDGALAGAPFALHLQQAVRPQLALARLWTPLAALPRHLRALGARLGRGASRLSRRPRRDLRLCEMLQLSDKRFLAVVRYGDVHFLIGGAPSSLTLLSRLEPNAGAPLAWNPAAGAAPANTHAWSC